MPEALPVTLRELLGLPRQAPGKVLVCACHRDPVALEHKGNHADESGQLHEHWKCPKCSLFSTRPSQPQP